MWIYNPILYIKTSSQAFPFNNSDVKAFAICDASWLKCSGNKRTERQRSSGSFIGALIIHCYKIIVGDENVNKKEENRKK